jgi:hypothetical protein
MSDVTRRLNRVQQGAAKVAEALLPLVSDQLRKLAAHKMTNEISGFLCDKYELTNRRHNEKLNSPAFGPSKSRAANDVA